MHYYEFELNRPCELVCNTPQPVATCKPASFFDEVYGLFINPPLVAKNEEKDTTMNTLYGSKMPSGDLTIQLAPAASASVSTKSDVAIQRDYLMTRLDGIRREFEPYYGEINQKLRKQFNLDVDNTPKTAKELIEKIKGGKFKLDERKMNLIAAGEDWDDADDDSLMGPFAGIDWDGPTPDKAGYDAAAAEFKALLKDTKDTIIVKSPDDGLAALKTLEAWTPTGKAN